MSQQRLSRVQLLNWGTFSGAWGFDVPWKGMLLTGPSGAGKSSVLDAMASILVSPGKVRFNAAAQGTDTRDHDRSLITYVRGAHKREADEETGEVGAAFLRKGPTWSGVALTFADASGDESTLLRLFHISGSSTRREDLKTLFAIAPGRVDLLDLQSYAANGLEYRQLKSAYPGWNTYRAEGYAAFAERFRRTLGIGSEQAQVLLHKTQSAKNLTNLDGLFRDYMLDVPETFELAETTVEQFGELRAAHTSVVEARRQAECLQPLRGLQEDLVTLDGTRSDVSHQQQHLDTWLGLRRLDEAKAQVDLERPILARLVAEIAAAQSAAEAAEAERRSRQQAVDRSGGGDLAMREQLRDLHLSRRDEAVRQRGAFATAAELLGLTLPTSASEVGVFVQQIGEAGGRAKDLQADSTEARSDLLPQMGQARDARDRLISELDALRRHRSNLDFRLLGIRDALAEVLQLPPADLPFVGELMQVRATESEWTGAIERVLGGLARTLVVPDKHYLAAAEYIDREHLGARLVYERVDPYQEVETESSESALLPSKIELADGEYRGWLAERLRRRYGYACVESARDLSGYDRAVTRRGQVKHASGQHEKDDRRGVDDRSRWVLGFSTEAKEAELERQHELAVAEIERVERLLSVIDGQLAEVASKFAAVGTLGEFEWERVDVAALDSAVVTIERELDDIRAANVELPALEAALTRAEANKSRSDDLVSELKAQHQNSVARLTRAEREVDQLEEALGNAATVPEAVALALDEEAAAYDGAELRDLDRLLREHLHSQATLLAEQSAKLERQAIRQMDAYRNDWRAASADWDSSREFLPEFLARLEELEDDRLPEFEERFFDLLNSQARNNISAISQRLRRAGSETRARVEDINRSLLMTRFSREGRLQIKVLDRALPEVDRFRQALSQIVEGSMLDAAGATDQAGRREAEERFIRMESLLSRLGSDDPADKTWRGLCLDTRQHVQFQAKVIDDEGKQVDVYTGSGGRSGGERQKLVTFCLAAALRFQLAQEGQTEPLYALVVIDEAFDKADHAFTQAGLEVFRTFGFQLLLATPMKMLQTIDDFVGGVVMVTNEPGIGSALHELHYDLARPTTEEVAGEQDVLV